MNQLSFSVDTVLMPVPLRLAHQVADFIADLNAGRIALDESPNEPFTLVPGQGDWSERMVAHLAAELLGYTGVVALFDHCAERPNAWVAKSDVESERRITPTQLRNELAALSKKTKKIFSRSEPIWPVEWKKEKGAYFYRMDATIASWWVAARGGRDA